MDILSNVNEIINFETEDKKSLMELIILNSGAIFRICEINSIPTMILLTLKNVIKKLKELNIDKVYNLVLDKDLEFLNKEYYIINKKLPNSNTLIEIKSEDLFNFIVISLGINELVGNL
jgi:hypothetical protein